MSRNTEKDLRNLFLYQVYIRNHTEEGTFKAFQKDLDRIQKLGVDFVYFIPIHPIGQKKKKGDLGCPYSIQDYRAINPEYGTIDDFKELVQDIHQRGMKVMIDVVYNHTSHDSVLLKEHPEYFYKNEEGEFANRVGDWWDITDLDYTKDIGLWEELIDTLLYWQSVGVDGFRWDVASILPLEFMEEAHERLLDQDPNVIFLSESVHGGFCQYLRNQGFGCLSESEIYQVFDMAYDYDLHPYYEGYLKGEISFERYIEETERQEQIYPDNYVKLRNLENHDYGRFAPTVNNDMNKVNNWTALTFFQKGATMIYAGQERLDHNRPSLFDKDLVNWDGKDISPIITKLAEIVKDKTFSYGFYSIHRNNKEIYYADYRYLDRQCVGLFNIGQNFDLLEVDLPDGTYTNILFDEEVIVKDKKVKIGKNPIIMWVE